MNLVDTFGSSVVLDTTDPNNPKLVITLKNLENTPAGNIVNGVGLDNVALITALTKDDYADKIRAALFLLNVQKQPATNTVASDGCWITPTPTRNFVSRGGAPQVSYSYTSTFYKSDTLVNLEPNLVL